MAKKVYECSIHCAKCPYERYDYCMKKFKIMNGFPCEAIPVELENPNPDE